MQNIEEIYIKYFEIVYKYLFCLTHNADLAEELAQETFFKATMKIHTFKENSKVSTWLCKIAKNLWYNEIRHNKKINMIEYDDVEYLIDYGEDIVDTIISKEEKERVYRKIKELDSITREVINLRIIGNLSFKEIGNILEKSENWARVTFYRGKNKLKEGGKYDYE